MSKRLLVIFTILLCYSCATLKYKKQGFVTTKDYIQEIPFEYVNHLIFIPVTIEDKTYNFLLDTGAELNLIDATIAKELNLKSLKKGTVSNYKDSEKRILRVEIGTITIAGIDYHETAGLIWDISKFSDIIGCVKIDGLIGNNLMRKSNWQIDYDKKIIRISDNSEQFAISANAKKIKMNSGNSGNVLLNVEVRNTKKEFTFDTGYNGFIQTGDMALLGTDPYQTRVGLTGANFTGKKEGDTYYSKIDSLSINGTNFQSPTLLLVKPGNGSVLGNEFYENFIVTIDWKNDQLIFDQPKNIQLENPDFFEVGLYVDYGKDEILTSNISKESILLTQIKTHSRVLKINGIDVTTLKGEALCDFWDVEWQELKKATELTITIASDNGPLEFVNKKVKSDL